MLSQACDDVPFGAWAYIQISTHAGARTFHRGLIAEACFSIAEVPSHWHIFCGYCDTPPLPALRPSPPPPPHPGHTSFMLYLPLVSSDRSHAARYLRLTQTRTCPTVQNQGLSKAFFYTPEVSQNVALHALSAARQSRAIKCSLSYG